MRDRIKKETEQEQERERDTERERERERERAQCVICVCECLREERETKPIFIFGDKIEILISPRQSHSPQSPQFDIL